MKQSHIRTIASPLSAVLRPLSWCRCAPFTGRVRMLRRDNRIYCSAATSSSKKKSAQSKKIVVPPLPKVSKPTLLSFFLLPRAVSSLSSCYPNSSFLFLLSNKSISLLSTFIQNYGCYHEESKEQLNPFSNGCSLKTTNRQ